MERFIKWEQEKLVYYYFDNFGATYSEKTKDVDSKLGNWTINQLNGLFMSQAQKQGSVGGGT